MKKDTLTKTEGQELEYDLMLDTGDDELAFYMAYVRDND